MLDLEQFAKEFVESRGHCNGPETVRDNAVVEAINHRDWQIADRKKSIVDWLDRYKVFMGLFADSRSSIAGEIIGFADERLVDSLHQDKNRIVTEFNKLKDRIAAVAPLNPSGKRREVISLASKALWCCYPNDVPIFDRNALNALRVISRLCHFASEPGRSEYACFVDVWLHVYREVESAIDQADLSECPYKVRVLDRLLWHLGQNSFFGSGTADK